MKKPICILAILFISLASFSQSISNTSNTITFNTTDSDCPYTPSAGTHQLDFSYFDMSIGDWVHLDDITVTVTVDQPSFTIDASSVIPAVNFPPDEFINTLGHIVLSNFGTKYELYFDIGYINCQPLGLKNALKNIAKAW